jgi:DNA-binding NarL/FixJ family response regulator
MARVKVILVDDHPIVRSGIKNLLDHSVGIDVIGEASDGNQGLEMILELQPDGVLLDMGLPGMPGNEIALHVREQKMPCSILALSAHDDRMYIQEVLANGAQAI